MANNNESMPVMGGLPFSQTAGSIQCNDLSLATSQTINELDPHTPEAWFNYNHHHQSAAEQATTSFFTKPMMLFGLAETCIHYPQASTQCQERCTLPTWFLFPMLRCIKGIQSDRFIIWHTENVTKKFSCLLLTRSTKGLVLVMV